MSIDSAHKSHWQTGEAVFGFPFLVGIILQFIIPLSLPGGHLRFAFIVGGIALIFVGLSFIAYARQEFAQGGQPTDPGHPTTKVIMTGVFSISRNPIYLGAVCLLAGVALVLNIPWVLAMLLPGLIACQYVLIAPEERYLANKLGQEYRAYTASVHRWIGRA